MKIPNDSIMSDNEIHAMFETIDNMVYKLSANTGVYVETRAEYDGNERLTRVFFVVLDREFESLTEVRRVIRLKMFA